MLRFRLPSLPPFRRDAKLMLAVTGLSSISFFGIQLLLAPLFVLRLGHGPEFVGLYSAAGAFTYMAMALPSGAMGSRLGIRKVMLAGGLGTALGMVMFSLTEFVPRDLSGAWPILSQVVLTIGWSLFEVNLAPGLMGATASQNRRGAYALSSALRGAGTLAGTLSGGIMPGVFARLTGQSEFAPGPYRLALWVGAAIALGATIPLCFLSAIRQEDGGKERTESGGRLPLLSVGLVVLHAFLINGAAATCGAFCNVYMDTALGLGASSIGVITAAGQMVGVMTALLGPRMARKRSGDRLLVAASFGIALSLLPLALLPHWAAAGLGRLGLLAFSAVWLPALQLFQMELAPARWRSLAYGATSMAFGLSFGTVSLGGGYLAGAGGYRAIFGLGVALAVVGALLMTASRRYLVRSRSGDSSA